MKAETFHVLFITESSFIRTVYQYSKYPRNVYGSNEKSHMILGRK